MHTIDIAILVAYFVLVIGAGFYYSRKSATGMRSYFLGDNQTKWWMLAASGASTNYSINGTVWMISILMVLGMKSWWTTLIWWMPSAAVLMAFMGIWIRRTGVMTAAELNKVRFGTDGGAIAARIGFAVMITLFSVAQLALSYFVIHKFAKEFGFDGHLAAMTVIGITGLYVLVGGFRGVILTDFLQTLLLFAISFIVGYVCFTHYTADQLHEALTHGNVTTDYWHSLAYDPHPKLGAFAKGDYGGWNDFAGAALAFSVVGLIGSIGGAGGRYGEQRFLATKNGREAGWMAALWALLALPRWVFIGGLAFLAMVVFREQAVIGADPDAVVPLFLQSDLLGTGIKGLVVTGLVAAYMSTFSSEINATASIVVRDLYEPIFHRERDVDQEGDLLPSYVATAGLVVGTIAMGYALVRNSSLNDLWMWMLGGLVTCFVIPLAMRWYWGRMNGWGFAAGSVIGLLPALVMLAKQFVGEDARIQEIPDSYFTYAILLTSLLASVVVSLITRPVEPQYIDEFYRRVRPFGWWRSVSRRALASGQPANAPLNVGLAAINVLLSLLAMYSLYMSPVYFMGKWYAETAIVLGLFAGCCVALYFTWYKTLPDN